MENSVGVKDQIIKNSFWNIIGSLANRGGSFIFVIILSRLLMPEGFGRYSLAMTVALFFITFSDMGINQALIRYASINVHSSNKDTPNYFFYLFKIKIIITMTLSIILFLISYPLSVYIFKDILLFPIFIILSFYIFLSSLTSFFESLFFIKKKVKYVSIIEALFMIMKIGILIVIGFFLDSKFRLISIMGSFVVISLLTLFSVFYFIKKDYPSIFIKTENEPNKKEIKKFIFSLNIQNLSLMIISQFSIILLGIFLPKEYVGYFNSALVIIFSLSNLFIFSSVLLPSFTNIEESKFKNFVEKIFRFFLILTVPLSFGLSIFSKYIISFIYGEDYLIASTSLSILSFLIPCIVGVDLSILSFSSRNKQKKISALMGFTALIFMVLNYLFIKFLSTFSAENVVNTVSIINLIIWISCFFFSALLLKKEFNIQIISAWLFKIIFSSLLMSIFLSCFLYIFGEINIIAGALFILSGILIYFLSLFLVKGFNREEVIDMKNLFFKKNKS